QADRRALALGLHPLKVTGRTKGMGGFEDGVEPPKEQQGHILAGKQGSAGVLFRQGLAAPAKMRSWTAPERPQGVSPTGFGLGQSIRCNWGGAGHATSRPVPYHLYKLQS